MAPRVGVVTFPGSNCEHDVVLALERLGAVADLVWHGDSSADGYDALVLPGGFAHGDYLRPGAIARFSPVMEAVEPVRRGGRSGGRHLQRLPGADRGRAAAGSPPEEPRAPLPLHRCDRAGRLRTDSVLTEGLAVGTELSHPDQPLRGQLHLRPRDARGAPGRGAGGAPLRGQPERLGRRHRGRLQRSAQRGRAHAASRTGVGPAARLGRRVAVAAVRCSAPPRRGSAATRRRCRCRRRPPDESARYRRPAFSCACGGSSPAEGPRRSPRRCATRSRRCPSVRRRAARP